MYSLYEDHIVPLQKADLRPTLKSIILSILPAIEEESSEDFERAFNILQSLQHKFASVNDRGDGMIEYDGYFWQCLFLAVITSASRRQGGLNYLNRNLPAFKRNSSGSSSLNGSHQRGKKDELSSEALCVLFPEPGLLVRCFVCGLLDQQMLIQRGFLDLLVSNLPLDSVVLQERSSTADLDRLVSAAAQVLLRRDMGLNRRLWTWFLGPEPKELPSPNKPDASGMEWNNSGSEHTSQLQYFSRYGKASLERSISNMLQSSTTKTMEKARPYRICLSLMDRWEIGGLLVPQIFLPAMKFAYQYYLNASSNDASDVLRSASLFFDGVEASLIWGSLIKILQHDLNLQNPSSSGLQLIRWIVGKFNVKDEEMLTVHIPHVILYLLSTLNQPNSSRMSVDIKRQILDAISQLADLLPERSFQKPKIEDSGTSLRNGNRDITNGEASQSILKFYEAEEQSSHKTAPPFNPLYQAELISSNIVSFLVKSLTSHDTEIIPKSSTLLISLLSKCPKQFTQQTQNLRDSFVETFTSTRGRTEILPFQMLSSATQVITNLGPDQSRNGLLSTRDLIQLEPSLSTQFWAYLSPANPKYHVEAVKLLWQLERLVAPGDSFMATLTGLVRNPSSNLPSSSSRLEVCRRFAVLWNHSLTPTTTRSTKPGHSRRVSSSLVAPDDKQAGRRYRILQQPLMLILQILDNPNDSAAEFVKSWLQGLTSLEQIFQILFEQLHGVTNYLGRSNDMSADGDKRSYNDQVRELDFILHHFHNILSSGSDWTWRCLTNMTFPFHDGDREEEEVCLAILAKSCARFVYGGEHYFASLNKRVMNVLRLILSSPVSTALQHLELDSLLLDRLITCIDDDGADSLQGSLLNLSTLALKLRFKKRPAENLAEYRLRRSVGTKTALMASSRPDSASSSAPVALTPPPQLFKCLKLGFASKSFRYNTTQWLAFTADVLPNFADALFADLLPLVECLCGGLEKAHEELVAISLKPDVKDAVAPESTIIALLDILELVLNQAVESLSSGSESEPVAKVSEPSHGFLANMRSGVFKVEGPPSRHAKANSRLTVVLAFQDMIRVALKVWLWAVHAAESNDLDSSSAATTLYNALKVRNRTRFLLEQIFTVELLESVEVLISRWCSAEEDSEAAAVLSLLHVMQVSRPKNVVPAILDSLCSRNNPTVLADTRISSQTVDINAADAASFLSSYLSSVDDDAMDEVWPDCIAFLRDVLANPLPHRQILPHMLSIVLLLAEKLSNTNFGEQRKMRRDLGDIFQRLLSATFTSLPSSYVAENAPDSLANGTTISRRVKIERSMSLVPVLNRLTSKLDLILETSERTSTAVNNISGNLIASLFRAKSFPNNISIDSLSLLMQVAQKAPTAKSWRKEVADAFNDQKLLASSAMLMTDGWFPILHYWSLHDKERMPEILSRLLPPTSAGIVFGVGATAARLEADRKAQFNLRRVCVLLLASPEDTHVSNLRLMEEKLAELFDASPASSPSAAIKAELFMLCRALVLSSSPSNLAPLWPLVNDKLQSALTSLMPGSPESNDFGNLALLQACKLLDSLIAISPDDFQLHEWLYITDTIDAVYKSSDWAPAALSDQVAEALGSGGLDDTSVITPPVAPTSSGRRRLLLSEDLAIDKADAKALPRDNFTKAVLRPFLSQLSMNAYESVYTMDTPDIAALKSDLLADVLDLSTIVE